MPLTEHLERVGGRLFCARSTLPLAILPFFISAAVDFTYPRGSHTLDLAWEMFAFAVSLTGLVIRALTIGYAPHGTSGRNTHGQVAETLNTSGMYSVVRHPLYFGNFLITLGVSLFFRTWWLAVLVALSFALYYERIMLAEEAFLRRKFGSTFLDWAKEVPAFIPKFSRWKTPELSFSFKNVLKREYHALFGIVVAFNVAEFLGDYFLEGEVDFDPVWIGLLGAALVMYLVVRILKKRTNFLFVAGR